MSKKSTNTSPEGSSSDVACYDVVKSMESLPDSLVEFSGVESGLEFLDAIQDNESFGLILSMAPMWKEEVSDEQFNAILKVAAQHPSTAEYFTPNGGGEDYDQLIEIIGDESFAERLAQMAQATLDRSKIKEVLKKPAKKK